MNEYPIQRLIFFVAQDIVDSTRQKMARLIAELATQREWVISPPSLIDVVDDATTRSDDLPDETLGGVLEIYSAMLPNGLPRDLDLAHLEEVEHIIRAVQQFSRSEGVVFEFELDGRFVGAIEDGVLDRTLEQGLIGEWRKHLEEPRP